METIQTYVILFLYVHIFVSLFQKFTVCLSEAFVFCDVCGTTLVGQVIGYIYYVIILLKPNG